MLNVIYAECREKAHYGQCRYAECHYAECRNAKCHYAECHYAEYRYAECRYAECRGAILLLKKSDYLKKILQIPEIFGGKNRRQSDMKWRQ